MLQKKVKKIRSRLLGLTREKPPLIRDGFFCTTIYFFTLSKSAFTDALHAASASSAAASVGALME